MKFLSRLMMAAIVCLSMAAAHAADGNTLSMLGEIGDYGVWMNEENANMFNTMIREDIEEFRPKPLVDSYVPIEAMVGLAFMNAMTYIGDVLDASLVRFVIIFIIVMFALWLAAEAYKMMRSGENARAMVEEMFKKALWIIIWLAVLNIGPAKLFAAVIGPIIGIAAYMSDLILNAVTGAGLPDTCAAIREYAVAHTSPDMILGAQRAADIMCVPTRMSGFFYTAVATGWQWVVNGIGHSFLTVVAGLVFIVLFAYNIWKFALIALGVIADLFLAIFMLPFTAIAETVSQTKYDGIPGQVYNGLVGLFKVESLELQIQRFVNAALYFVSLSIVVAVCTAILSSTLNVDWNAQNPAIDTDGFMVTLLTGALVAYLASRADELAKDIGGAINHQLGNQVGNDIKNIGKSAYSNTVKLIKIMRGKK